MMILLSLILLLLSPAPAHAVQTPTLEATPSSSNQQLLDMVNQKVKEKLQQLNTNTPDTTTPKFICGNITGINGTQVDLNSNNLTQSINISDSTVFYNLKKNKISYSAIKVGQDILAMGYSDNQNILQTKRLLVVDPKSYQNANQVIIGKIVDISQTSPIFVLIPSKNNNTQYQIKMDSKTTIVNQSGQKYNQSNLTVGQKVIVIISPDAKIANTYYANKILLPNSISPTPSTTATSSAKKK